MADESGVGDGHEVDADGQDCMRGGAVDPGLPVQPRDQEGSGGDTDLRLDHELMAALSSIPDDVSGERPQRRQRRARKNAHAGNGGGLRGGDDGGGGHRERCGADVLQTAGKAAGAGQRNVALGHRKETGPRTAEDPEAGLRDRNGVLAGKLSRALELSLDWDLEILEADLPPNDTDAFASVVRAKGQASQTVKMLAARIDDNELKKQALGRLPELLKLIQEEEGRMKLIEAAVG